VASARDWNNDKDDNRERHHHKIGASEMVIAGIATAGLIGVAGYLVLRKRTIA